MENETIQAEPVVTPEVKQEAPKKAFKINKKVAIIIGVIVVVIVLIFLAKGLFIAATVDGSPISRLSVIERLEKASGKSLLDNLISERLIQNAAAAKKIVISDDVVNAEIKKIEAEITAQGQTMEAALAAQGMSMDDLKTQIVLRKDLEGLLADKISVTDEEVAQYIKDNSVAVPVGQESVINEQTKSDLSNQKFSSEVQGYIADLKAKASIKYYVNY